MLEDIAARLKQGTKQRNVILIASDLSHDPGNKARAEAERIREFDEFFNATLGEAAARDAFLSTAERDARAHLMLLRVTPPTNVDKAVAARVVERFNELHPSSTALLSENPAQLEAKLQKIFSSAVRVENPRRTTESTVAFTLVNPCGTATVSAVRIGPVRGDTTPLEEFLIKGGPVQLDEGGRKELSITDERLKAWAGSNLQIQAVFDGKVESKEFFFGDSFLFENVTPALFPRFRGSGTIVLRGRAKVFADDPHDYTITINHEAFPVDQRSFTFNIDASGGRVDTRNIDVAVEVPREVIKSIPIDARLEYEVKPTDTTSTVVGGDAAAQKSTNGVKYPVGARVNEYEQVVLLIVVVLIAVVVLVRSLLGKATAALALYGIVTLLRDLVIAIPAVVAQWIEISPGPPLPTWLVSLVFGLAGGGVCYVVIRACVLLLFFDRIESDDFWRRRASRFIVTFSFLVSALILGSMLYSLGLNGRILETQP